MSHTCNVAFGDVEGDLDKEKVRDHFTTAGQQILRAGGNIFTALSYVETLDFESTIDDLEQCLDRVDETIEHLQAGIEMMEDALPLKSEAQEYFSAFDYQSIKDRAQIEGLFLEDEAAWRVLTRHAKEGNVIGGPQMYLSLVTELRTLIRGLIDDIEAGHDDDHLLRRTWRLHSHFFRTLNVGAMLSYYNRETRNPAGTGKAPSKTSLKAGQNLIDS